MKTDLYIEHNGRQIDTAVLIDAAKEFWKSEGNRLKDIQSLELYFKPEEGNCYYVINNDIKGNFAV